MSFLKTVSEARGKKIIKQMIHARVGGNEPARGQETIHASDLTKTQPTYCPRAVRLMELTDPPVKRAPQFLPVATAITFNEGRDKQARLNNDWLRDVMYGTWRCRACSHIHKPTFSPYPDGGCDDCGYRVWEYLEPRIIDFVSKTSGGIDAVVDVGKKKLHIVECKIMKADQFKGLAAPLSEHRVRTRLYLRQIAGSKQKYAKKLETDYAHILYIMRGHGYKQEDGIISPFKEFIVERDDSEVQHFIGMAHALTLSRQEDGYGFPAGICSTQMCDRAKACPVSKQCFSENPGTITWLKKDSPVHEGLNIKWITDGEKVHERSSY